ncbi:hypothetical protein [Peribacillus sp. FSL E2-0218]|uniref:hypothetical protein n=1 Tax=Peribacillus sp. FSL E2-0218 TaxID=2921364 RepID=UPI0030EC5F1D
MSAVDDEEPAELIKKGSNMFRLQEVKFSLLVEYGTTVYPWIYHTDNLNFIAHWIGCHKRIGNWFAVLVLIKGRQMVAF